MSVIIKPLIKVNFDIRLIAIKVRSFKSIVFKLKEFWFVNQEA